VPLGFTQLFDHSSFVQVSANPSELDVRLVCCRRKINQVTD
jgi:hypothetical protein